MRFTKSELEMIGQYAAATKEETVKKMKGMLPGISDELTRVIVRNAAEKLEKVPEPECSRFITEMRASFLGIHKKSVRLRLAEARERVKQPPILGHDLAGPERFQPETRHMIVFDVLNSDSPAGFKGERYRCFLSDQKYDNARASEKRGEIRIRSHAAVAAGKLHPDKKAEHER